MATIASSGTLSPRLLLARQAEELVREVYASFPVGYRLARVLTVLATDSLDAFGRVISAEMILAVVRGMADIDGKPAFDWIDDVHGEGADILPSGTGRSFAQRVFKILLSKFGEPEVAEEAMSQVMLQSARQKLHIKNGSSLHEAESYIVTACLNSARDIIRARGRRRENPLVRDRDDDDGSVVDVEDHRAFDRLDKLLPASEFRSLLRELEKVHPRAAEWLQARLEGQSGREIAEEWGTSPSWVTKWERLYLPRVKEVAVHHLRSTRSATSTHDHLWFITAAPSYQR